MTSMLSAITGQPMEREEPTHFPAIEGAADARLEAERARRLLNAGAQAAALEAGRAQDRPDPSELAALIASRALRSAGVNGPVSADYDNAARFAQPEPIKRYSVNVSPSLGKVTVDSAHPTNSDIELRSGSVSVTIRW